MSKINYIVGDLFTTDCKVIAHQVNTYGVMGAGVALIVKDRFPKAFEEYYQNSLLSNGLMLGDAIIVDCGDKIIANIVGQNNTGRDGALYTSYDALHVGLTKLNKYCVTQGITEVAMPMIGAGLGGGDWTQIEQIIEEALVDVQPIVYKLQ